jgi:hypothetical protein
MGYTKVLNGKTLSFEADDIPPVLGAMLGTPNARKRVWEPLRSRLA